MRTGSPGALHRDYTAAFETVGGTPDSVAIFSANQALEGIYAVTRIPDKGFNQNAEIILHNIF